MPTCEQILVMPPGREMDAAVAPIAGWSGPVLVSNYPWQQHPPGEPKRVTLVPRFSTDIVAAFQVNREEWYWTFCEGRNRLTITLDGDDWVEVTVRWSETDNDKAAAYALGRCRAALIAEMGDA